MLLMYILSVPLIQRLKSSKQHLVLPHLYSVYPQYVKMYKMFAEQGDFIMQDNSIFELKNAVAGDLLEYGRQIGAKEIVVPEVLRDANSSLDATRDFFANAAVKESVKSREFQFAACVQGDSYREVESHYEELNRDYEEQIDTICIPFNFEFDAYGDRSEEKKHSGWNRFSLIHRLVEERIWNVRKSHHLLGLYNPAELSVYRRVFGPVVYGSIRSNDSSSCFWHSLYGVRFTHDRGLPYRKIETHVDFSVDFLHGEQSSLFYLNKDVMEYFKQGMGGRLIRADYQRYAVEAGISLSIRGV